MEVKGSNDTNFQIHFRGRQKISVNLIFLLKVDASPVVSRDVRTQRFKFNIVDVISQSWKMVDF